jgi:hypothetical protein
VARAVSQRRVRDVQITVRTTVEEREWFLSVAKAQQVPLGTLIRYQLAMEGARLGVPNPAP